MTKQELINSGDLELYVAGKLPEDRMREISSQVKSDPDLMKEVEQIEQTIIRLARDISPIDTSYLYTLIAKKSFRWSTNIPVAGPNTWLGQHVCCSSSEWVISTWRTVSFTIEWMKWSAVTMS